MRALSAVEPLATVLSTPISSRTDPEDSEPYVRRFKAPAERARKKLQKVSVRSFSIAGLLQHFARIYRNQYFGQDPWKLGMHLAEEIGEATTELSRIDLRWRAEKLGFRLDAPHIERIAEIARRAIKDQTKAIKDQDRREKRRLGLESELSALLQQLRRESWTAYGRLVRDKFKEEIADVFSWAGSDNCQAGPDVQGTRQAAIRIHR